MMWQDDERLPLHTLDHILSYCEKYASNANNLFILWKETYYTTVSAGPPI